MVFSIQILGSNSALAAHGRHPTAQVLNCHNELMLIDCGEGTQMRMSNFHVKRSKIENIFISHLHGDHYFGLIGLLTSYHLMGRRDPLTVYAPPELEVIISHQLHASLTTLKYPLHFRATQVEEEEVILDTEHLQVLSFPLKHRIPTTGFLFREKQTDRRINKERIAGIPLNPVLYQDLKSGRDIVLDDGRRLSNADLTLPPHSCRTYAYCTDTLYFPELVKHIEGVDLLYHEATFLTEDEQRAAETFHSTTAEAAGIARLVGAHQLLIGHFSSKYPDLNVYLDECKALFPETSLAIEGNIYEVTRKHTLEVLTHAGRAAKGSQGGDF